jgi:hypothetical protein
MIASRGFDNDFDEDHGKRANELVGLENELAAAIRQFARATAAHDDAATAIETETIADRIRRMLYLHLEIRIGMSSDDWVWLDGQEDFQVHVSGTETKVSGRIYCTLPAKGPRREWTEPVAGVMNQISTGKALADYSISFGTRATLLDLSTVKRLVASGEKVAPPPPATEDGWAYVFRMDGPQRKLSV